jgi:hypothetical protein
LESRMSSLRGRKMYGVFYGQGPEEIYYACVKLDDEHDDDMGLNAEPFREASTLGAGSMTGPVGNR